MSPETLVPDWPSDIAVERVFLCVKFLVIHGFITDSEKDKIERRVERWIKQTAEKTHAIY